MALAAAFFLQPTSAALPAAQPGENGYRIQFLLSLKAGAPDASVHIRVSQPDARLKRLRFDMPAVRFTALAGDGTISRRDDAVTWQPPARGGELRYRVTVTHPRSHQGHDAYIGPRWALFRAEDVFPGADATLKPGARSHGELLVDVPPGWSLQTPYQPDATGRLSVTRRGRAYERPVGWIMAGEIGSRMDVIGATTVRVSAPRERAAPRLPSLALLRWTLPVLQAEIERPLPYLLITLAGEPMWRGGLSAPNSFFLHADRPLISENATSPLLHELLHVMAPVPAAAEHDWIDEGMAEYLGLVLLVRSGTISRERFDDTIELFHRRGAGVRSLVTRQASGAVTARAVAIFSDVDRELQAATRGKADIFDLLRLLQAQDDPVDLARLRELATVVGGRPLAALGPGRVPAATARPKAL